MEEFKKGELVRLRSGGPIMTVAVPSANGVQCAWFSKVGEDYSPNISQVLIDKEMLVREPSVSS